MNESDRVLFTLRRTTPEGNELRVEGSVPPGQDFSHILSVARSALFVEDEERARVQAWVKAFGPPEAEAT